MYNILCYGDSNTWGVDMEANEQPKRLVYEKRWTGILSRELGENFRIFEEGLPGRTTAFDNPLEYGRNGEKTLEIAFLTHDPLDVLVLMLGTNDMKDIINASAQDSSWGLERDIIKVKSILHVAYTKQIKVLIVSPILQSYAKDGQFYYGFSEKSIEKSKQLAGYYGEIARLHQCEFLDAAQYAKASPVDGTHIANEDHEALGKAIADKIRSIID